MFKSPSDNVKPLERTLRIAVGSLLVAAAFDPTIAAPWVALLAIYPLITATLAWDPVYALLDQLKLHVPTRTRVALHAQH